MPLLSPIRGLCPLPDAASSIAELPYDVMSRDEAIAMAAGRPHSFLHVSRPDIDLPDDAAGEGPRAYALAAQALAGLVRAGLLVREPTAAYHAYRLTRDGHHQTGVVGGADVAAYDEGRIRRHETTRPAKQADRAAHIEAVGAQTGPAFLIHRRSARIAGAVAAVTAAPAPTVVEHAGIRHEVWPITAAEQVRALQEGFDALPVLYIADGHHRSAAASIVHARRATAASAVFLAVAFPADEVVILPYNRLARGPEGMTAEDVVAAVSERFAFAPAEGPVSPGRRGTFGMYAAGRWYRLEAPADLVEGTGAVDRLDVSVLQDHVLAPVLGIGDPRTDPRIGFVGGVRPCEELESAVDSGLWTVAFTLHATTVRELLEVADDGGIMPPKSTWFEPKLLDGLVSHVLD